MISFNDLANDGGCYHDWYVAEEDGDALAERFRAHLLKGGAY